MWAVVVARGELQVRDNVINDVIDEQLNAATHSSVDEWLADIKMSRYRENFARCGYTRVSQLARLTRRDLTTRVGVSLVGHQKKILNSIQALRAGVVDPLLA